MPYIYEKTPLTDKNSNDVSGKNKPAPLQSPEVTKIISSNFAGSTLFNLTAGLGEELVQEFVHRDMIYKEQRRPKNDRNEATITGKSLSEALNLGSTNPQYDKPLFIDLPVQYMKTTSSEHGENMMCAKIVLNVKTKTKNDFCAKHVLPMF